MSGGGNSVAPIERFSVARDAGTFSNVRKLAFTLAEVLVTLGIIGIVAAMTMPALITESREQEYISKLKKIYSILSQAYISIQNESGSADEWAVSNDGAARADTRLRMFTPYMKVIKDCGLKQGCTDPNKKYTYLDKTDMGSENLASKGDLARIILADGTLVIMHPHVSPDCSFKFGKNDLQNVCAMIWVDVNGNKAPNQVGVDAFRFYIAKKGIIPAGTPDDSDNLFEDTCNLNGQGDGCAAWVIFNGNMDYRHCNGLSWGGKTKCK